MKTSITSLKRTPIIEHAHQTILDCLTEDSVAIDMTVGNGHDTVFLAKHAKTVYGFDIQEKALKNTRDRLELAACKNVKLFLLCHSRFEDVVKEPFTVMVFNLGYLPGEDQSITTKTETTLLAVKKALNSIQRGGLISLTLYPGHAEGKRESEELERYLTSINRQDFTVIKYQCLNRFAAPYNLYIIKH